MARKKKRSALDSLSGAALGVGKLGVGLGVSGAVIGKVAAVSPSVAPLSSGISTVASFAPIAVTAVVGKGVLGGLKELNKGASKFYDKKGRAKKGLF